MIDRQALYLSTHEWAKKGPKSLITVGLSAYAIEQLGEIISLELPQVGKNLHQGDVFGVIQSVKSAVEMCVPVSGKVAVVNAGLSDNPDLLKTEAYGKAWMIQIEPVSPAEFDSLMDAEAYEKFLQT